MDKKILIISGIVILVIGLVFAVIYFRKDEEKNLENYDSGPQSIMPRNENIDDTDSSLEENNIGNELIKCLADAGVVVYGSETCPACVSLADSFGGYEKIEPIFVECGKERERCSSEMKTGYVPEIQIKGELYEDSRNPEDIARKVNCEI